MTTNQYSPLMRLVSKSFKYLLLVMLGFAIAYILSIAFGALPFTSTILPLITTWFWKLGVIFFCFLAGVVIFESLR